MLHNIKIYNTLSRKKETFKPINPPLVGMYVCGPTVYGDPHLGHARPSITFDVFYRYLKHVGYKVRYVRNITDVGHMEGDADEGEDKVAKKARLEQLEPMEVAQLYTDRFHDIMQKLSVLPPTIEPRASGHIIEQIQMTEKIIKFGFAYEVNGSVYFDLEKYVKSNPYGKLSGRVVEDLLAGTRKLEAQQEKKSPLDFALWKKANSGHIMQWPSPWSDGFPGWHLECSVMSSKYLGAPFDIHGGGLDLLFPHHECEIAQSRAANNTDPVKYWMHNNLITINGQKMGKSLGNFITLEQLFTGNHDLLEEAYSPMTIRFFILQSHYRGTLDFSNKALKGSRKGFIKLMNGLRVLENLSRAVVREPHFSTNEKKPHKSETLDTEINQICDACYEAMNDDFNTAKVIAALFDLLKKINGFYQESLDLSQISKTTFGKMKDTYRTFVNDILGLTEEKPDSFDAMLSLLLNIYWEAKQNKNYDKVDEIRAQMKKQGIILKDLKGGVDWAYEE